MRVLVILAAALMAACAGAPIPGPSPQASRKLPTIAVDTGACRDIGLDAILHGDPDDPRLAWLVLASGRRQEIVWRPGFSARFMPGLQILDSSNVPVLQDGDRVLGACVLADSRDVLLIRAED